MKYNTNIGLNNYKSYNHCKLILKQLADGLIWCNTKLSCEMFTSCNLVQNGGVMVALRLSLNFSDCSLLCATHILTFNLNFNVCAMPRNIAGYHFMTEHSLLSP
jgi:hypothetical protein